MRHLSFAALARRLRPTVALAAMAALLALLSAAVIPLANLCGDAICFYTAGRIIASGGSPYDVAAQARIQAECGWDKATDGGGKYEFMPYFYPPWFALLCTPMALLSY